MSFSRSVTYISRPWGFKDDLRRYANWKQLTREEQDEITQVLSVAHEHFVKWASPDSWTSSDSDMHQLRGLLGSVGPAGLQISEMDDHEVARAVHQELRSRRLIYIPPPWEIANHIERERARRSREAKRRDFSIPDEVTPVGSVGAADIAHRNASRAPVAPSPVAEFMANEAGEDVNQLVAMSPGLLADLKKLADVGWQIQYGKPGGGSETDRLNKLINIDSGFEKSPKAFTKILSHEIGHAMYPYEPDYSSKDVYVHGTLADEGAATMVNIRTQREILRQGGPDIGVLGANHASYNQAYDQYLNDGNAAACRQAIGIAFGNEVTSNARQTYSDYYGGWYDQAYSAR
ncbi:hypothetical protein [Paraburkholderia sp.]|jgi:hypothetical protein|uniref:hypothetical protein n=1 Tax=Paraburkholderia sp. TaxID=1926495 RepID=UPI002F413DF3